MKRSCIYGPKRDGERRWSPGLIWNDVKTPGDWHMEIDAQTPSTYFSHLHSFHIQREIHIQFYSHFTSKLALRFSHLCMQPVFVGQCG